MDSHTFSLLDFDVFTDFVSRADSVPATIQTTIIAKAIKLITENPCNLTLKYPRFARGAMLNEVLVNNGQLELNDSSYGRFPFRD